MHLKLIDMLKVILLVLIGFLTVATGSDIEREIGRLLEKVKKAPPEERYKVMNELKLRELNRREREEGLYGAKR